MADKDKTPPSPKGDSLEVFEKSLPPSALNIPMPAGAKPPKSDSGQGGKARSGQQNPNQSSAKK